MATVHDFLKNGQVDLPGLSKHLDSLDGQTRIAEIRTWGAKQQARIYEAAKGYKPISVDDFVPKTFSPLKPVIHYGKNSLPLFSYFQKRFCRPDSQEAQLWGYNEGFTRPFVGPGYFVARPADAKEVVIDYFMLPPKKPEGWPNILPNSSGLSRFVYFQMQDFMRGISKHVSIGRATRNGKVMDAWFVLCREDPLPA